MTMMPWGRSIGTYATAGWDEWGSFPQQKRANNLYKVTTQWLRLDFNHQTYDRNKGITG